MIYSIVAFLIAYLVHGYKTQKREGIDKLQEIIPVYSYQDRQQYYDVSALAHDFEAVEACIDIFMERYKYIEVHAVAGVDGESFLGPIFANALQKPYILIKKNKPTLFADSFNSFTSIEYVGYNRNDENAYDNTGSYYDNYSNNNAGGSVDDDSNGSDDDYVDDEIWDEPPNYNLFIPNTPALSEFGDDSHVILIVDYVSPSYHVSKMIIVLWKIYFPFRIDLLIIHFICLIILIGGNTSSFKLVTVEILISINIFVQK